MSLALLNYLNGKNKGIFYSWLQGQKKNPHIAWYPSAGTDFRPLMYLHGSLTQLVPAEPSFPDIFIYTDYFPWKDSTFLDSPLIFQDASTKITVEEIEQLPNLHLTFSDQIVHFPEGSQASNKVVFMKVKVESERLGTICYPVLYAFVENEAFFSEVLLPKRASISHILQIRYGGGFGGGGYARGTWILHVLQLLNTKMLIACNSDIGLGIYNSGPGDQYFLEQNPNIPRTPYQDLTSIRETVGKQWSSYGDVIWYLVH